jgi:hypothetical protein
MGVDTLGGTVYAPSSAILETDWALPVATMPQERSAESDNTPKVFLGSSGDTKRLVVFMISVSSRR